MASRITSRHHKEEIKIVKDKPKIRHKGEWKWSQEAPPQVIPNNPIDTKNGHGLISTTWNGWRIISFFKLNFFCGKEVYLLY